MWGSHLGVFVCRQLFQQGPYLIQYIHAARLP